MAHVTMSDFADADMVLAYKLGADFACILRLPLHVGDAVAWTQIRRGISVAIQAELHGEWLGLKGERHVVDAAVAAFAADALCDMHVVAEINIVGQARDAMPSQRGI